MTYDEQLQTPEWKALRDRIIERDLHMCQKCMSTKNLQAHHKFYEAGKMAWESSPIALITLCDRCHSHLHEFGRGKYIATPLDIAFARLAKVADGMRPYSVMNYIISKISADGKETI